MRNLVAMLLEFRHNGTQFRMNARCYEFMTGLVPDLIIFLDRSRVEVGEARTSQRTESVLDPDAIDVDTTSKRSPL